MNNRNITFVKLSCEGAILPKSAHEDDLGLDLTAISVKYDEEHDMYVYDTGVSVEMPEGIDMIVAPRSSNRKTDAYLANMIGIIDNPYRGTIQLCFKNRDSYAVNCMLEEWNWMKSHGADDTFTKPNPMTYSPYDIGDRVGQAFFVKKIPMSLCISEHLSETVRGEGGFGSTGK